MKIIISLLETIGYFLQFMGIGCLWLALSTDIKGLAFYILVIFIGYLLNVGEKRLEIKYGFLYGKHYDFEVLKVLGWTMIPLSIAIFVFNIDRTVEIMYSLGFLTNAIYFIYESKARKKYYTKQSLDDKSNKDSKLNKQEEVIDVDL